MSTSFNFVGIVTSSHGFISRVCISTPVIVHELIIVTHVNTIQVLVVHVLVIQVLVPHVVVVHVNHPKLHPHHPHHPHPGAAIITTLLVTFLVYVNEFVYEYSKLYVPIVFIFTAHDVATRIDQLQSV